MKKIHPNFLILIVVFFTVISVLIWEVFIPSKPYPLKITKIEIVDNWLFRDDIKGRVKNEGSKSVTSFEITVYCLNEKGEVINIMPAKVFNDVIIKPQMSAEFSVPFSNSIEYTSIRADVTNISF